MRNRWRLIIALFTSLVSLVALPICARGDSANGSVTQFSEQSAEQILQNTAQSELDHVDTHAIDAYWHQLESQYGGFLPKTKGPSLIQSVLEHGGPSFHGMVSGLMHYFFQEVVDDLGLFGGILILSVAAALLRMMQASFAEESVGEVAQMVVSFVLAALVTRSLLETFGSARQAIESMNHFMLATMPVSIALLAGSGSFASAAFFQPMLIFCVHFVSNVVFLVVFPLVFLAAVLELASSMAPRYPLTRLASLARTAGLAVLSFALVVFVGVTAVQGTGRGIADGLALRTMKFGVGTFVPVVGKAISDAAETVLGASLLVKNAVGIAGLIVIALIAAFPALKILAVSAMYSAGAAVMQPVGETPIIACLGALGKTMLLVFASVATVALMFFFAICILLAAANLAVITA
ncbi:stage III sporulation protein AE [Alicyclobacillus acidocaldarius]|uniref:Stage III sporulation protein AE n=1 Tax=Alicyclobacillus acidocaldarius (strain Tc-4-1) TaxID=1048834 RepID=F8IL52_ALIAT|nr:stage III sporulation protein AE [Alicyclobacillus acidocaldarius]AEJ43618.1 stage III sporulation protein AE [Alicyclobacillus acidocaldarius subsp. acidocaldarius Tc-4-1]